MEHGGLIQGSSNVVISTNDSDVLILGAYVCALHVARNWFFNHECHAYADLRCIADSLGDSACYLPQFHSLTGCDTTSLFYFRGRTKPWDRAMKSPGAFQLIKDLGNSRNNENV